jgi:hypothetical protein
MSRIAPSQAAYLSVLTDAGTMADDAIVSNNGGDEWMIVHGSGDTMSLLQASAKGKQVEIEFTDALHDISCRAPGHSKSSTPIATWISLRWPISITKRRNCSDTLAGSRAPGTPASVATRCSAINR